MQEIIDSARRRFLLIATSTLGAIGAALAAIPFVASWQPSARAKGAGAPVEVDLSEIAPGEQITVEWRGQPVWILHRTQRMLDLLPTLDARLRDPRSEVETQQPAYVDPVHRAIEPEWFVVVGICTHLGCVPTYRPDVAPPDLGVEWKGGYFCPCHGSRFDLAGRVYAGVPAPTNLVVPPYRYVDETRVEIGVGPERT
ncbi:MAG: ubiquinol-cytochrome c reductase iron-sulfur subunit [Gammaproteobacteria bacterium]|nr:ubiquinol-cytochrome c reductase iron-sulfur subunit [Gammaproteobacteria bacterium]NIR84340.1 ubiquinol-cytochrome c reductase iron-sulfur subunit [Gammaproteobacteria bacterium]NIR89856.1 ubiquinol-cytochrome c reductase iron-sulfur subunit [Gammaproteobacteria bacterium]NIU05723.1 ubiquinol-cytochrome c reductase iron-sulfur subunit [Gammaproteobacteria bacterium]NIV52483.1 ubiquinol-cytochrome c reductase iron-sulfur subunit [Gammaproteobacteria bacterium]